ncbi:MAG: putative Nudix hydrolase NudL [Burkholderiaceae bacterium]|nr:putative Nudix hydrolase NudL [Burkholderiaceae bacterium]
MAAEPPTLDERRLRERLHRFDVRAIEPAGRQRAAVAVTVTEAGFGADLEDSPVLARWSTASALLLTRRAIELRAHAGQWAMPGGRIDGSETPEAAALRELHEEVGLVLDERAVLGRLDDYATRSGYVITPVVVWAGAARDVAPNAGEVASIHRIPVRELLRAEAPLLELLPGAEHPVLRMPIGPSWIAAPTAAFLYQFREWCVFGRDTRVAHFDQPEFAWK